MSDNESVHSAASEEPQTINALINSARASMKELDEVLKQAEKMAKKVKVKPAKSAKDKKPRKVSEGQKRWQAFQKYVWDQLKQANPATPYKEAMRVAGERKREGHLDAGSKHLAKFETWLKANPLPTEEEREKAKADKAAAVKAARETKKAQKKKSEDKAAVISGTDTEAEPAAATAKQAASKKKGAAAAAEASESEASVPAAKKAPAAGSKKK